MYSFNLVSKNTILSIITNDFFQERLTNPKSQHHLINKKFKIPITTLGGTIGYYYPKCIHLSPFIQ
jgi:hypothetical protein